jgi:4-nitrophenyl phosphatase
MRPGTHPQTGGETVNYDDIQGVIADMDGVLWRGDEPLPGMDAFFALLHEADIPFMLATNNSSKTRTDYIHKLAKMGVTTVAESNIITSGTATIDFLLREYPIGADVQVLGGAGLHQMMQEAGFPLVEQGAEVVVVGLDFDVTYDKIKRAVLDIRAGARFIATNPDPTFPSPEGQIPGNGALVAAVQTGAGTPPEFMGKPHAPMFETALAAMGTDPAHTLMIGDRLNTDIQGAAALGMPTALLLSGVTTQDDLITSDIQPTIAYEGVGDVVKAWDYQGGKRRRSS